MEQLRLSKRRIHYLGLGGIVLVIYLQLTIVNAATAEKYVPNTKNNRINRERPPLVVYEDPSEDVTEGQEEGGNLLTDSGLGGGGGGSLLNGDNVLEPGEKRLTCAACESPHCEQVSSCSNAVKCWSSRHRDSYGYERYSKGCVNSRARIPFMCSSQPCKIYQSFLPDTLPCRALHNM